MVDKPPGEDESAPLCRQLGWLPGRRRWRVEQNNIKQSQQARQ
jgi:hypothetical protein